jgi:regulator of sirC expression with transglutaminase-like and TPR domain
MESAEIKALINLLEDPDEEIYRRVSQVILSQGIDIIPELERTWEKSLNEKLQDRIERLIQEIHFSNIEKYLTSWVDTGGQDLLEGAVIVSRLQYPDLSLNYMNGIIDDLRQDIWLELNPNLTALEKVRIINHFLFEVHKFSGNIYNMYSPQNSYINQVLETKKGNPVSLSIVYMYIAQKLGIPILGINLPRNFLVAYMDDNNSLEEPILFYINPYSKGSVVGKKELENFLIQQGVEPTEQHFTPCTNIDIIQRLILNLIMAYDKMGYKEKINDFQKLLKIVIKDNKK